MGSRPAHVHVDETPWPVLGVKEWLWVSAEEKFCLFHADTRSRVELDQQGLSLTALSAAMTSVCTTATQQDPNRNVWHICGVTSKKWQVGSCQPSLGTRVLDLIDEALLNIGSGEKPRMRAYQNWTVGFKSRITQSIQQWIGRADTRRV